MVDLLALVTGAAVVATTAVLVVATLDPPGIATRAVAVAMVAFAAIVLPGELLSLIGELGRGGFLLVQGALLACAVAAWTRAGRPNPAPGIAAEYSPRRLVAAARRHPLVAGICGAAAAAALLQLVVGLIAAPTNWDSMTYHLSRAAYWLQEGAAFRFDGGSARQLDSMPNAELGTAWTMALAGSDRFVELIQWFALLTCAAGIAGLARTLGYARREAAVAAALFVVLPGAILQSVTTQNDLVTSACLVSVLLLGVRGIRAAHTGTIVLAGVALGLALGTKGTMLLAAPAVVIVLGTVVWESRPPRRILATALAAGLAGFALLGAFQFVQNLADTGSPFGDQRELVGRSQFGLPGNAARVLWNFVDSPGVPLPAADRVFGQTVQRVVAKTGDRVSELKVDADVGHDTVAGGLVGWLVLWPLVLVVLLLPRTRPAVRAQAAAALSLALVIAVQIRATPYNGRILLPALALAAPLLAIVARHRFALGATSALAALSLVPCLLISPTHMLVPERGEPTFLGRDRLEQMAVYRPDQIAVVQAVDRRLGATGALLFVGGEDSWDYPYFGSDRRRRLVRATPAEVPKGEPAYCRWILERLRRDRLAGAVIVSEPGGAPVPSPALRAERPGRDYSVIDSDNLPSAC